MYEADLVRTLAAVVEMAQPTGLAVARAGNPLTRGLGLFQEGDASASMRLFAAAAGEPGRSMFAIAAFCAGEPLEAIDGHFDDLSGPIVRPEDGLDLAVLWFAGRTAYLLGDRERARQRWAIAAAAEGGGFADLAAEALRMLTAPR